MFKRKYHHNASSEDCNKLCCTKIEIAGDTEIFTDVNMHIHCGQLTALIGPNGAGKSTLLKCILGQVPHSGNLHYVEAKGKHTGNPIIGYVPQYLRFDRTSPTSVMDFFAACLSKYPVWLCSMKKLRPKVLESLRRVKAEHLIDRRLGALSGGEMQRVLLSLALNPMPDLLLLDEPVSGVDHNGLKLFYEIVSELREKEDMAIVLISHDLPLVAQYADQVVLLNKKVICKGTPQEVFNRKETKALFGNIVAPLEEEAKWFRCDFAFCLDKSCIYEKCFFGSVDDYTTFGNFKHYGCQQSHGIFF